MGTAVGGLPAAPVAERLPARKRSLPPIADIVLSSNGRNAPVACNEADQVLPMFNTSGPWPEVVAARIRLYRSGQPITSSLTVIPVCCLNLSSSGCSTCLSWSRLVPWLLAQYVSVVPAAEPESEELPQAAAKDASSTADA